MRSPALLRLAIGGALAAAAGFLCNCSSAPKSEVIVSVKDQKLGLYKDGKLQKKFLISTSKFGLGDQPNSYRTPLGKHEVIAKIGHGLPKGAVLKSRSWNGEVLKPNAPGRDPIVSRILWLRGMEKTNKNAQNRFIYIHGTTEEFNLGKPASYGCIRMGMADVVDVFNEVAIGAKVVVTKGGLPHGGGKSTPVPQEPATDPIADAEPILIAGGESAAPQKAADAASAPAVSAPVPVDTVQESKASSKGFLGLFGKKRSRETAAEPAIAAAPPGPMSPVTKKPGTALQTKPQIKIGPELPANDEVLSKKKPEKVSTGFFSLKNKWPLRRSERTESAS